MSIRNHLIEVKLEALYRVRKVIDTDIQVLQELLNEIPPDDVVNSTDTEVSVKER